MYYYSFEIMSILQLEIKKGGKLVNYEKLKKEVIKANISSVQPSTVQGEQSLGHWTQSILICTIPVCS